jgi:hypothetical protein
VHWDGAGWSASASGTVDDLYGVWANGPDDVWAVGDFAAILHRDGAASTDH